MVDELPFSTDISKKYICSGCSKRDDEDKLIMLEFVNNEEQRRHFKSDWHEFNLQRRINNEDIATYEEFLGIKETSEKNLEKETEEFFVCYYCDKYFNNDKSLGDHLLSGKHDDKIYSFEMELVEECEENVVNIDLHENICLFCNKTYPRSDFGLEDMIIHMKTHLFFIPSEDLPSDYNQFFLTYLRREVYYLNNCIYCYRHFQNEEETQRHMEKESHTSIGLIHMKIMNNYNNFYERISEEDRSLSDNEFVEYMNGAHISEDNARLVLDNGISFGHRSHAIYYRQTYFPNEEYNKPKKLERDIRRKEALRAIKSGSVKKEDLEKLKVQNKLIERQMVADRSEKDLKLSCKKNNQKHFREQLL